MSDCRGATMLHSFADCPLSDTLCKIKLNDMCAGEGDMCRFARIPRRKFAVCTSMFITSSFQTHVEETNIISQFGHSYFQQLTSDSKDKLLKHESRTTCLINVWTLMCEFADALFVQVGNSESAILPTITPVTPSFTPSFHQKWWKARQMFLKYAWSAQFVFSPRFIVGPYLSSCPTLKCARKQICSSFSWHPKTLWVTAPHNYSFRCQLNFEM